MKNLTFIGCIIVLNYCNTNAQSNTTVDKTILPFVLFDPYFGLGYGVMGNVSFVLGDTNTTRYSNAQLIVMRTTKKQTMIQSNHQLFTNNENYLVQGKWMFIDWPENVFGLGGNTPENTKELITYKALEFDERVLVKIKKTKTFLGLNYRLYHVRKMEVLEHKGNQYFSDYVAGKTGYTASGLGGHLVHDSRDHVQNAYRGKFVEVAINPYVKVLGSTQNWMNIKLDYRHYLSFGKKRKTLASRILAEQAIGETPYMVLPMTGRYNTTRGYVQGRYRGTQFISAETELRYNLHKWLGAVTFINVHSVSEPNGVIKKTKLAVGSGLRFMLKKNQRTNLRIDYAKGAGNNSGLYFQITEVF